MNPHTPEDLATRKCRPCEGEIEPLSPDEVRAHLAALAGWSLAADGRRIRKQWTATSFAAALDFFTEVGALADAENHHPDLYLESYRNVTIELRTHAVEGLSENDFILAAKIDRLPAP